MMNPNNFSTPDQPKNQTAESWFSSLPSSSGIPNAPKRFPKFLLVLASIVLLVLLAGGAAFLIQETGVKCLTTQDTSELYEVPPDIAISAKDGVYTADFTYEVGSSELLSTSERGELKKLATFYQNHADKVSVAFSVNADYTADESPEIAEKRQSLLLELLEQEGVPLSVIQVIKPSEILNDDDIEPENDALNIPHAYVTLLSEETCKE